MRAVRRQGFRVALFAAAALVGGCRARAVPSSTPPPSPEVAGPEVGTFTARAPAPPAEDERVRGREERRRRRAEDLEAQPKVTAKFVNQDLREVLASIAEETKTTIVLFAGGQSTVDLEFRATPLETALDLVLFPIDYVYARRGASTYVCGPADPALPVFREIAAVRTMRTNGDPVEIRAMLPEKSYQPFVRAVPSTHSLTITAPADLADRIADFVVDLDPVREQFVIEVCVTSVEQSAGELLGNRHSPLAYALGFKGEDSHAPSGSVVDGAAYVVSASAEVLGSLEFLERAGKAQVRTRPRVVATEGVRADIQAVQEYYVPIAGNQVVNPEIEIIKAGVKMGVTPRLLASGAIEMDIEPEVADVIGLDPNNALPIINRRTLKSTVRVRSGDSLVIGGLYQSVLRDDRTKTPGLGDVLPLKPLFSSREAAYVEGQLVIVITPRRLER